MRTAPGLVEAGPESAFAVGLHWSLSQARSMASRCPRRAPTPCTTAASTRPHSHCACCAGVRANIAACPTSVSCHSATRAAHKRVSSVMLAVRSTGSESVIDDRSSVDSTAPAARAVERTHAVPPCADVWAVRALRFGPGRRRSPMPWLSGSPERPRLERGEDRDERPNGAHLHHHARRGLVGQPRWRPQPDQCVRRCDEGRGQQRT